MYTIVDKHQKITENILIRTLKYYKYWIQKTKIKRWEKILKELQSQNFFHSILLVQITDFDAKSGSSQSAAMLTPPLYKRETTILTESPIIAYVKNGGLIMFILCTPIYGEHLILSVFITNLLIDSNCKYMKISKKSKRCALNILHV